jgi:hypothetical protein
VVTEVAGRFAGSVVDDREHFVLTGLAERGCCRSLAVHQLRLRRRELDGSRSAILRPQHCHTDGLAAPLRQAVVSRRHGEGRAVAANADVGDRELHDRRQVRADVFAVAAARCAQAIDLPYGLQRGDDLIGAAVRGQLPHQRLVAEVFRYGDLEDVLVPPGHEMRRLSAIAARLERVFRPDRNVELLLVIAVHIAEPHVVRAVGVDVEALVDGRHALARPVTQVDELRCRLLRGEGQREPGEESDGEPESLEHTDLRKKAWSIIVSVSLPRCASLPVR